MEVPSKCANGGLPSAAAASPAAKVAAEDDSASGASVNNSRKDGVSTGGGTLLQMHKPLAHTAGKMASVQAEGPCYRCTSPWLTCWLTVSGGRSVGSTATSKSITDSCTGARRISRRSGRHPRRRIRLLLTTTINRTAPTAVMMTMTASTPVHHHLPLRHHVSTPWSKSHFPLSSHLIFRRLSRTLNDAQLPRFISSFVIKTFFFLPGK